MKRTEALVDVICRFKWSCVNIICSSDSSTRYTVGDLATRLSARNVCVALSFVQDDFHQVVSSLQLRSSVSVLLGDARFIVNIFNEARKQNLTRHTWVVHEATSVLRLAENYSDVMTGMLGLSLEEGDLADFKIRLRSVTNLPSWYCAGLSQEEQVSKGCRYKKRGIVVRKPKYMNRKRNTTASVQQSTGLVPYVIDAVLALGRGLHEVTKCTTGRSKGSDCGSRGTKSNIVSQRLVRSLKKISFTSIRNKTVWFDRNGDLLNEYTVVNAQMSSTGKLRFVSVGAWIDQGDEKPKLILDTKAIRWPGNEKMPPYSGCAQPCGPGTYRGAVVCWWVCHTCPKGTYTDVYSTSQCKRCPKEQMTNEDQTGCIHKPVDFLHVTDNVSVLLFGLCGLGELLTLVVLSVFIKFHRSHVVKASNLFYSAFTLVLLMIWFVSPLLAVGHPTDLICQLRMASFSFLYTTVSAALFTKTNRVVRIFNAIKTTRFLSNVWYSFLTCALILVQVALCVVHGVLFPPNVKYGYESDDIIVPICRPNYILDFVSLGYNTLLALLCACSAFKSRRLPGQYNEVKWICFVMLVYILSWATLLIVHLFMIDGRMKTTVMSLGVISGAYAVLIFLFLPKLHVIFFKPEKNTKQAAVASTRRFSFDVARKSLPLYDNSLRRHTSPECLKLESVATPMEP